MFLVRLFYFALFFFIFQLALDIAKQSEENLALIRTTGIIDQIFGEIDNKDVLLRMNIVELLSNFGSTKHGLAFLEENKIIFKLFAVIEGDNDPIGCQLCEPGKKFSFLNRDSISNKQKEAN